MTSLIVDTLATALQMVVGGGVMMHYIQARRPWLHTALFVLLISMAYFITGYTQQLLLRAILTITIQVAMCLICTRIPRTYALAFIMTTILCMFLTELPSDAIISYLHPGFSFAANLDIPTLLIWKLSYLPAVALAYLLPYWICQRCFQIKGHAEISKYLPFFALQAVLAPCPPIIFLSYTAGSSIPKDPVLLTILCAVYLLSQIGLDLLLMHTFGQINRAHALELREEQARNMLQAQMDYYNQLQDNSIAIRQLRHDMNNQLQTLSILLENGDHKTAQAQLASLCESISRTGKTRYTGNPVVDAVIESKIHTCTESGFSLHCTGSLPAEPGIQAISLCSIAANLLDNAIHACRALSPEQSPEIRFSASRKGSRLLFCCENPVSSGAHLAVTKPELNQEHGWGLSILQSIAADHHGDLQILQQDNTVKVILWLALDPFKQGASHESTH